MLQMLFSFLAPIFSLLPVFTVIGAFAHSIVVVWVCVAIYYILSTRVFVTACTVLNAVLWPIGFIVALALWHWAYAIAYAAAFGFLLLGHKRGYTQ